MAILDAQGRLFSKVSVLDLGAGLMILFVLLGIFFLPGSSGKSIADIGVTTKPVEVDILVLGLSSRNPEELIKAGETTNFIIRNQPYGQVKIKTVDFLPNTVTIPQPDGSAKAFPDPRPEAQYSSNLELTLEGKGQLTGDGPVFGNSKIKVGTPVELEGKGYNFKASVIDVRVGD